MTPTITISAAVLKEIDFTLGKKAPEQGGMLGGRRSGREITHFYFDHGGERTRATYSPDVSLMNAIMNEIWKPEGVEFLGFIHTHPGTLDRPSAGDLEYARTIVSHLKLNELLLFIATTDPFAIHPWVARRNESSLHLVRYELKEANGCQGRVTVPSWHDSKDLFSRVNGAYDLERLEWSRVVLVGTGGSAQFAVDLARAGVGEFALIDPDVIEERNLATQQYRQSQLGKPKVEALREDLLEINPNIRVVTKKARIEDLDDGECKGLFLAPLLKLPSAFSVPPRQTLLCGCTDSFPAQARVNRLALQFGLPCLSAQVYREGRGAEVTFTHPDTTRACQRCILSTRYAAYTRGFENDVTSSGTPIFSTGRLNAIKGFVALALLHHGTDTRWGRLLRRMGNRNLILLRLDPDIESSLGMKVFSKTFRGAKIERLLFDDTVFIAQSPQEKKKNQPACPDCGGSGNLRDAQGTFEDTRVV